MSPSHGLSDPAGATLASSRGVDGSEGSWVTFLSHHSGDKLLYRMRPDGGELAPIFGGDIRGVPGLSEGQTLYRLPHWSRQSPDRTLFLSWATDVSSPGEQDLTTDRFMIHLGRTDGGPTRVLAPDGHGREKGTRAGKGDAPAGGKRGRTGFRQMSWNGSHYRTNVIIVPFSSPDVAPAPKELDALVSEFPDLDTVSSR